MDKQIEDKSRAGPPKRQVAIIGIAALAFVLIALLIIQLNTPKRSVAAYCKVYKVEKVRLAKLPGNTYPSGVFNEAISDASEYEVSFARLGKVAPEEIKPDVATLQSVYKKIHNDPSIAISASLSGAPTDSELKQWTADHCGR